MTVLNTFTLVIGVVISTISGLVCYLGCSLTPQIVSHLPSGNLLLAYPETALVGGVMLILIGIICQPNRAY
jgi:hypothetical protein